jgi:hypothetical protein
VHQALHGSDPELGRMQRRHGEDSPAALEDGEHLGSRLP